MRNECLTMRGTRDGEVQEMEIEDQKVCKNAFAERFTLLIKTTSQQFQNRQHWK